MSASATIAILQGPSAALDDVAARLRGWGYDVRSGADPYEVLWDDTDVIMVDAGLEDGMAIVGWLKGEPATRNIPLVAATLGDPSSVAAHALALGADDVLTLPIEDVELFARMRAQARLAVMETERRRRERVLAEFGVRTGQERPGMPAVDPLAILLVGPAGYDQVQVTTALGGAATVAYAETPQFALERLRRQDLDAAVITASRDDRQIEALCAAIREDPALFDLPVILIARGEDHPDRAVPFEWGVSDVLLHPFHPEILRLRIQCWVRQQRLRRRLRAPLAGDAVPPTVDRLSGLYNHGFLHAYLEHAIADVRRLGGSLALAAFSVSGMGRINREHGFAAGDRLIAQIGSIIMRTSRAEDLPARLGDDRFCLVVSEASVREAQIVAERIAEIIMQVPLAVDQTHAVRVGLEAGAAGLDQGDDAHALVARAFARSQPVSLRQAS